MRKVIGLIGMSSLVLCACAPVPPSDAIAAAPLGMECALRDAPFSINSPLYDVMLSDHAVSLLKKHMPEAIAKSPAMFSSLALPNFANILDVRMVAEMAGLKEAEIATLDADLRTLPVTDEDRIKRCERFDNRVPQLDIAADRPNVLVFEKINGFKYTPSVVAAHAAIIAMGERKGWNVQFTEFGGAFNAKTLSQFDAVLWNNVSGDVLTVPQRAAFQDFLANGGGFVGIHGAAGDPAYFWDWYPETLLGARFLGHPMEPQLQEARVVVHGDDALTAGLPSEWRMTDEWYSFKASPTLSGARVVLSLDESSYTRTGPGEARLSMGEDHPIAWTKCIGKGRMFYSAIGHAPETYSHPINVRVMENGLEWAMFAKDACS